ncbi:hypothetical protein ABEH25_22700 [Pantoea agglomerans]
MKSNRREIIVFERSLKLNVRFWHKADVVQANVRYEREEDF